DVAVGRVVQQHHIPFLGETPDAFDQVGRPVLQDPSVGGQVDAPTGGLVPEQPVTGETVTVAEHRPVPAYGALEPGHAGHVEPGGIDVGALEDLERLPD